MQHEEEEKIEQKAVGESKADGERGKKATKRKKNEGRWREGGGN